MGLMRNNDRGDGVFFIVLLLGFLLAFLALATKGEAQGRYPDDVEVFQIEDVCLICVVWPDGSGDCYESACQVCVVEDPVSYSTPEDNTPDSGPTSTPRPTPNPTTPPDPTDIPDEGRCNRGLGNGSEDCDPGNSGGRPGKAGEGDG